MLILIPFLKQYLISRYVFAIIPNQELLCYPEKASPGFPHPPYFVILTVWPVIYSTHNPPLIIELAMVNLPLTAKPGTF